MAKKTKSGTDIKGKEVINMANRIIRLISIIFFIFSIMMVISELMNPTLKGLEKNAFFGYVGVAMFLSAYSYFKAKEFSR